jgi:superfamily II DNA or RNA helicase
MPLPLRPVYFPSEEKSIDKVLFMPIFSVTETCKCVSAYFTSGVVSELAASLALFLSNPNVSITFVISPNLSEADHRALLRGVQTDENLLPLIFPQYRLDEDTLRARAVEALSVLVASGRMRFKVATMESDRGMMHAKIWLFEFSEERISVTGSSNATEPGLRDNFEQIRVDQESIRGGTQIYDAFNTRFESIWQGQYPAIKTFPLNERTLAALAEVKGVSNRSDAEIRDSIIAELEKGALLPSRMQALIVPKWLNYDGGDFAHQGKAIRAWRAAGNRGILSIATGGGKTLTALTSATLLQAEVPALLVVILVPTTPLCNQWAEEVRQFSCEPVSSADAQPDFLGEMHAMFRRLDTLVSKTEVLILLRETYLTPRVQQLLERKLPSYDSMLICDEVHNFGAAGFRVKPLECFKYRLGLSATVERQFDQEGTDFLASYFGPIVYEFSLKEAIGTCLVPFLYLPQLVYLTASEEDEWLDLTQNIKRLQFASDFPADNEFAIRLKSLRLARRRLIENADNKVKAFSEQLPKDPRDIRRTLVFCSDKKPKQLSDVNALLAGRGVYFHQITAEETANKRRLKGLLEQYSNGTLQVLTSKKVLDEGFNAPQTETAHLLATHTGKRQWIQRLGRVLRKSPLTAKTTAVVYDYIAVPQRAGESIDADFKALIRSELGRVTFFSDHSSNGQESKGSVELMSRLIDLLGSAA